MSRSITLSVNRPMRSVLRFRRWSRKGYAAFISLQHTVTIGCLAAAVADRFQQKQLSLHTGLNRLGEAVRREAHEIAASEGLWEDETKHPLWANGLLCVALQSNEVAHPATDAPYHYIGIGRRERSLTDLSRLFFIGQKDIER